MGNISQPVLELRHGDISLEMERVKAREKPVEKPSQENSRQETA